MQNLWFLIIIFLSIDVEDKRQTKYYFFSSYFVNALFAFELAFSLSVIAKRTISYTIFVLVVLMKHNFYFLSKCYYSINYRVKKAEYVCKENVTNFQ